MMMGVDGKGRVARVLAVLAEGERVAARVAARQAACAPFEAMARALAAQARQERAHAALANGIALWAGEDRAGARDSLALLAAIEARLVRDLEASLHANALFGMQGVVECLGEALLVGLLESGHATARTVAPVIRHVLDQERGHMHLGEKWYSRLQGAPGEAAGAYLRDGERLSHRMGELFADVGVDAAATWAPIRVELDAWSRAAAA